jgi:hypothetical protein
MGSMTPGDAPRQWPDELYLQRLSHVLRSDQFRLPDGTDEHVFIDVAVGFGAKYVPAESVAGLLAETERWKEMFNRSNKLATQAALEYGADAASLWAETERLRAALGNLWTLIWDRNKHGHCILCGIPIEDAPKALREPCEECASALAELKVLLSAGSLQDADREAE